MVLQPIPPVPLKCHRSLLYGACFLSKQVSDLFMWWWGASRRMQCKSLTQRPSRLCQRKILQTSTDRRSPLNDISHNAVMIIFFFRISRRLSSTQIESICVANPRVVLWMMTVYFTLLLVQWMLFYKSQLNQNNLNDSTQITFSFLNPHNKLTWKKSKSFQIRLQFWICQWGVLLKIPYSLSVYLFILWVKYYNLCKFCVNINQKIFTYVLSRCFSHLCTMHNRSYPKSSLYVFFTRTIFIYYHPSRG